MELKENRRKLNILTGSLWVIEYRGEKLITSTERHHLLTEDAFFFFNKFNYMKNAVSVFLISLWNW